MTVSVYIIDKHIRHTITFSTSVMLWAEDFLGRVVFLAVWFQTSCIELMLAYLPYICCTVYYSMYSPFCRQVDQLPFTFPYHFHKPQPVPHFWLSPLRRAEMPSQAPSLLSLVLKFMVMLFGLLSLEGGGTGYTFCVAASAGDCCCQLWWTHYILTV